METRFEPGNLIQALAWPAAIRTGAFDPTTGGRAEGAIPVAVGQNLDDPSVQRNVDEAGSFASLLERIRSSSVRLAYSSISFGEGAPQREASRMVVDIPKRRMPGQLLL
jgi:hypothetical protein